MAKINYIILTIFIASHCYAVKEINLFKDKRDKNHIDMTIEGFMGKYNVPGLSIALAKDGQIVLSKGYGVADKEKKSLVNNTQRFRVASLSKPITAIAIMKLVEQKKVSLNDLVFGSKGIFAKEFKTNNKYIIQIRIKHLLEHSSGKQWGNFKNDPMFQHAELNHKE